MRVYVPPSHHLVTSVSPVTADNGDHSAYLASLRSRCHSFWFYGSVSAVGSHYHWLSTSFFSGAGDGTQGLTLAIQGLYH
jgi:hypothetical protein